MHLRLLHLAAFIALRTIAVASSLITPDAFNIKTYASPSGRFKFEVDPTERYGGGPGDCKLLKNGRVLWQSRLPFTFYDAVVADDGTVAGYGYTDGIYGTSFPGNVPLNLDPNNVRKSEDGIRVAIFAPDGTQRLDKKFARVRESWLGFGNTEPRVVGMCLNEGRFTVVLGNSPNYPPGFCASYRMSDGKVLSETTLPDLNLAGGSSCSVRGVSAVVGTSLILLHRIADRETENGVESGAIFTLIDPTGAQVWELIALGDYTNPDREIQDRIAEEVRDKGAIFKSTKPGQFDLWLAKQEQRMCYSVARKGGQWHVEEVSRTPQELLPATQRVKKMIPFDAPSVAPATRGGTGPRLDLLPPADRPAPPPPAEPEKLGTFTLDAPPLTRPVRDISAFDIDDNGRIGFLRRGGHFVLVEQSGTVLAEVPVKLPEDNTAHFAWLAGDRWLVTAPPEAAGGMARAWWIDAAKKTLTPIATFDCPRVSALTRIGDGGFIVFATNPAQSEPKPGALIAFDAAGKEMWRSDEHKEDMSWDCISKLTVTSRGEIVAINGRPDIIQVYDRNGKYLRSNPFKILDKEGKNPRHFAGVSAVDSEGGFILPDSSIGHWLEKAYVRVKTDGTLRAAVVPKFKDGGFPESDEIRVSPDGHLWLSIAHHFLRLDDRGVVDKSVGSKLDDDALGNIAIAACDAKGRIYLADDQTGAVHVFDANGHKLHVCKLTVADTIGKIELGCLAVTDEGRVFWRANSDGLQFVLFASDGSREEILPAGRGEIWYSRLGAGGVLKNDLREIALADEKFAMKRKIDRWPDRRWFDLSFDAGVSHDGSFVVSGWSGSDKGILGFYSPNGDPRRIAHLPIEWDTDRLRLAGWNGKHLVFTNNSTSIVCDRDGRPVRVLQVPCGDGKWAQFITRDGHELWVLDFATRKVTRYAMPDER